MEAPPSLFRCRLGAARRSMRRVADVNSRLGVIRCRFLFPRNPVSRVIRCRFIFSGKNDEPTPDFPLRRPNLPTDGQGRGEPRQRRLLAGAVVLRRGGDAHRHLLGDPHGFGPHDRDGRLLRREHVPGDRAPDRRGRGRPPRGNSVHGRCVPDGLRDVQPVDVVPVRGQPHHHSRLLGRRPVLRRLHRGPGLGPGGPGRDERRARLLRPHPRGRRSPPRSS